MHALERHVHRLDGSIDAYEPLLEAIGERRFVLLGEASHGTHEFYRERARLTRALVESKGFTGVVVEADWPDAYRVNCFVRMRGEDRTARDALADFERFPTWMWRNEVVVEFVDWLWRHNQEASSQVGFYGLDLYSLYSSIKAVVDYLEKVDPAAATRARDRYECLTRFSEDSQAYGYAAASGISEPCEDEVVEQLVELHHNATRYLSADGRVAEDELFFAQQNARLARDAEEYYRAMFRGSVESWNLRDRHMTDVVDAVADHLSVDGNRAKLVAWAHNSHLGDARATAMGAQGELNVGQLVRERHGDEAFLIGFTTFSGTVTAASSWGGDAERKQVRPALSGSYESLLHDVGGDFFVLTSSEPVGAQLAQPRLERAIGVIYVPETERLSHYFEARMADQFDAVIHLDRTTAIEPLEPMQQWLTGELPETYPTAL